MNNISFCDYCNPCVTHQSFKPLQWSRLSCCAKTTTVIATCIGAILGCGVGGVATYRYCLKKFSPAWTRVVPGIVTDSPRLENRRALSIIENRRGPISIVVAPAPMPIAVVPASGYASGSGNAPSDLIARLQEQGLV